MTFDMKNLGGYLFVFFLYFFCNFWMYFLYFFYSFCNFGEHTFYEASTLQCYDERRTMITLYVLMDHFHYEARRNLEQRSYIT